MVGLLQHYMFEDPKKYLIGEISHSGVTIRWDLTDMYEKEKKKKELREKMKFMIVNGKIYMIELGVY